MKRLICFASLLALCLGFPLLSIAQQTDNNSIPKSSLTQKIGSHEITVVAIERMESYSDGDEAEFTPKSGEEVVLIRLKVQFTEREVMRFVCSDVELRDTNGNNYRYTCLYNPEGLDPPRKLGFMETELPFFGPKGASFKLFRFKGISFDLTKLESKQKE